MQNAITRIVETMESHQIRDCLERDIAYVRKIRNKINALANEHANKNFFNLLDVEKIGLHDSFALPATIAPKSNAPAIPKSLYIQEGAIGDFEHRIIKGIANLDNIEWWHRNFSRGKGFRINGGFLNQYPDFILKTYAGRIVVVETKGDDRDNSDSRMKLKIGKRWEAMSDKPFKYMMIFDSNPVDGAESLADALKKLEQM
jgi:type III restriction enzyme